MTTLSDKIAAVEKMLAEATESPWDIHKIESSQKMYRLLPRKLLNKNGTPTAMELRTFIAEDAALIAAAPTLIKEMLEVVRRAKNLCETTKCNCV